MATDFASDNLSSGGGDEDQRDVCRDFLRNSCIKGEKCKFKHPTKDLVALVDKKAVCHDFQNRGCNRPTCRYVHVTTEEEKFIRETGKAPTSMEPNRRHTLTGDVAMCGDFMKGRCNRGERCKFRHGDGPRSHDAGAPTSRYDPYSRGGTREPRSAPRGGSYQDNALLEEELMVMKEQLIRLRRQVVELTMTNDDLVIENDKLKIMVSNGASAGAAARYGGPEPTSYTTYGQGASLPISQRPKPIAPPNHGGYY